MREKFGGSQEQTDWIAPAESRGDSYGRVFRQTEETLLDKARGKAREVARVMVVVTALTFVAGVPKEGYALNLPNQPEKTADDSRRDTGSWNKKVEDLKKENSRVGVDVETIQEDVKKEEKKPQKKGRVETEFEKIAKRTKRETENRAKARERQGQREIQNKIERKIGKVLRIPRY
ncbi:MAG: hypothetical protein COT91_00020 [Candidatus Doudnabacteria bacterium CG10_big_fil_rev_8_21_14_0_10_41_10]|uniref:Uncharacterized protein n=1 Tax=Candidatus Doudnabacteria bacterium CG10_big_fil_rev_8_21_14_0_10_41_10 TaxID=1974551 RepID=A0A2H0VHE2_9BACT|nr:MAG: hypothetical protein COT91_00020 [Candidatus Doudnabacteria bacterium CG10_big_fil_rev_8_21_14_0_10_41_10]